MADYISTHTGQAIDETIDSIQNNTFSQVMYGQTPPLTTTDTTLITSGWYNQKITSSMSYQHPIGYIFEWSKANLSNAPDLTTPAKVAAYFGYGEWELFGIGRVTVGINTNDTTFKTDGSAGGEKTHKLSVAEMPSHNHGKVSLTGSWYNTQARFPGSTTRSGIITNNSRTIGRYWSSTSSSGSNTAGFNIDASHTHTANGGSQAHNNLQPYIVVYRYRRIG